MKISIITPIYKGNKYLNSYLNMINNSTREITDIEVIWVNDSPEIELEYDKSIIKNFELVILNNETNFGIHKSRVEGLAKSKGEYILFLDQDDEIMENTLISQYKKVQNYDMVLGNGYFEDKHGMHYIFRNKSSQNFAIKKKPYIYIRDFIISPGQCLIKKSSIPVIWKENLITNNGTDDYMLWLLMFNNSCKINCNYDYIYIHKYTGDNISLNKDIMYKSQLELLDILQNVNQYNKEDFKKLKRAIIYKHNYRTDYFRESVKNIDIFLYNVRYKLMWKGYRTLNEK